jgi:hypothetical protein
MGVTAHELDQDERERLAEAGGLAPSMHNTQPWVFRFRGRTVEVHREPRRLLPAEDPTGRMTLIGIGAAIFNLRVAAASLGYVTSVHLLPDRAHADLVAKVDLVPRPSSETPALASLFPYISKRRTNRQPFADRPIPQQTKQELAEAAGAEGAMLTWVPAGYRTRMLLDLVSDASFADADDPARTVERGRWVGHGRSRDGIPSESLGPRPRIPSSPVRDLAVSAEDASRGPVWFEDRPTLAVLSTATDGPTDWLVAGQALERVLLVATRAGLSASLLNQPIEHKDLRGLVRDSRTAWTASQVILRLGYGPDVAPTPRRPLHDVIDETDAGA